MNNREFIAVYFIVVSLEIEQIIIAKTLEFFRVLLKFINFKSKTDDLRLCK